ncbi:MAG: hypothetical protein IJ760_01280 [Bacteroidales bacterium]|nr:hypothetical protein [Bacteroidales bacterium]
MPKLCCESCTNYAPADKEMDWSVYHTVEEVLDNLICYEATIEKHQRAGDTLLLKGVFIEDYNSGRGEYDNHLALYSLDSTRRIDIVNHYDAAPVFGHTVYMRVHLDVSPAEPCCLSMPHLYNRVLDTIPI